MRSEKCEVRSAEREVRSEKCGARSAEREVRTTKYEVKRARRWDVQWPVCHAGSTGHWPLKTDHDTFSLPPTDRRQPTADRRPSQMRVMTAVPGGRRLIILVVVGVGGTGAMAAVDGITHRGFDADGIGDRKTVEHAANGCQQLRRQSALVVWREG